MIQINVVGDMLADGDECFVHGGTLEVTRGFSSPSFDMSVGEKTTIAIWLSPGIEPKAEYILDDIQFDFDRMIYIFKRTDDLKMPTIYCVHVKVILDKNTQ